MIPESLESLLPTITEQEPVSSAKMTERGTPVACEKRRVVARKQAPCLGDDNVDVRDPTRPPRRTFLTHLHLPGRAQPLMSSTETGASFSCHKTVSLSGGKRGPYFSALAASICTKLSGLFPSPSSLLSV